MGRSAQAIERRKAKALRERATRLAIQNHCTTRVIVLCIEKGWRCHLCGYSIPSEFRPMDPWAPTRDHVVPRGLRKSWRPRQPDDIYPGELAGNIQVAHRYCNTRRGDTPLGSFDYVDAREAIRDRGKHWPVNIGL